MSRGQAAAIVVGNDYREYSLADQTGADPSGSWQGGAEVHRHRSSRSRPMAYFAQFDLDAPAVGDGHCKPQPERLDRRQDRLPTGRSPMAPPRWRGSRRSCWRRRASERPRAGATCARGARASASAISPTSSAISASPARSRSSAPAGNGTAGLRAQRCCDRDRRRGRPAATSRLDYTFPNYNPNPEAMEMLHDMAAVVKAEQAPISRSASTAMATAAAWSTMRARRSSPTRWA